MDRQRIIIALLVVVALLLFANLMVMSGHGVKSASADIVEGKNIFSTHSPDGRTIYLWGYSQEATLSSTNVNAQYYGKVTVGGSFEKP